MKTQLAKSLVAAAALVVAGSALAQAAQPVRIKTEGLPNHVRERLEAKAQEGPEALIQYVNRTRMLGYQVRVEEIVLKPEEAAAVAAKKVDGKVAKADEAKK